MEDMDETGKNSVLVIDDDECHIDVLTDILSKKYEVLTATSGEAGIKLAHDKTPDLIMLDIIMPGMDGFETIAQLKKSGLTKDIPVIFITGQDSKEDEVKGLTLGAADYIAKPFHNLVVETRVHTQMRSIEQMRTIKRLTTTDGLTGLQNRRYFSDQLAKEWGRAIRECSWVSLIIIDIDNFKRYNENYGYPQGDELLCAATKIFRAALRRTSDVVARWGGEEFTMLLPRTDTEGALDTAERVRKSIEQLNVPTADGKPTGATVSIGIYAAQPIINDAPVTVLISGATAALGEAKQGRGNKTCVYKEP